MSRRRPRLVLLLCWLATVALCLPAARAADSGGRVRFAELSPGAEKAITKGLRFLASNQNNDGSWGGNYKPAVTALALMGFMVKGHFPERGRYGLVLDRAVAYLLKRSRETGGYFGTSRQGMYEHGLATLALSEAWGMSDRDGVREALKRAVLIILRSQNRQGGWRYHPQPIDADISVTVMQIVALASAQEAGILVPAQVIRKAVKYVKACQSSNGGFAYQPRSRVRLSSTAAGCMSLMMCGERDSKAVQRALAYLKRVPDGEFQRTEFHFYAHYYAIQAMYQAGEDHYQEWYPKIRDALLRQQRANGSWVGGREGHPAYGTSMAILILGVPYRFLPIYQR